MSGKQKSIVLSLEQKIKILERLKNGKASTKLAVEYCEGKSMISEIKKNWHSIENFTTALKSEEGSLKRKSWKNFMMMKLTKLSTCGFYKNADLVIQYLAPIMWEGTTFQ